jgi:hypothetical protein
MASALQAGYIARTPELSLRVSFTQTKPLSSHHTCSCLSFLALGHQKHKHISAASSQCGKKFKLNQQTTT